MEPRVNCRQHPLYTRKIIMITEIKGSDLPLEEASVDTTTLIFVIIGAFTVSSWFMRLVDYLEGGNKRV